MLPEVKNLVLTGNPIQQAIKDDMDSWIPKVVQRIPQADTIDGKQVLAEHREAADALNAWEYYNGNIRVITALHFISIFFYRLQ